MYLQQQECACVLLQMYVWGGGRGEEGSGIAIQEIVYQLMWRSDKK